MTSFIQGVREYRLLPSALVPVFSWSLAILELVLGIAVVAGPFGRLSALGLGVLTGLFLVAVSINLARGNQVACHCFGAEADTISGATIVREVSILVLAALAASAPAETLAPAYVLHHSLEGATAVGVSTMLLLGYALVEILAKMGRSPQ